jgi:primosomal protein N'
VACPHCGARGFHRKAGPFACLFCGGTARVCPRCGEGYLRLRAAGVSRQTGRRYPAFWGCSTYRADTRSSCTYSENEVAKAGDVGQLRVDSPF